MAFYQRRIEEKCLKDNGECVVLLREMQRNHEVIESDWETDSELEADFKLKLNFKLLMFTKVNFKSKPSAQLSSLMSMTASQYDKVASIMDPAVVAWEV